MNIKVFCGFFFVLFWQMVLTFPSTVNKLKKLNSCYFWISKTILFTLTYYIVTVWINVKCVILLKSEHLHVPLCIDLAVEFNLLKSTYEIALQETPRSPRFLFPSQSHYILTYKGNPGGGGGVISFCNKYGLVLNGNIQVWVCALKSNHCAHCRHHKAIGSALLRKSQHRCNPYPSV